MNERDGELISALLDGEIDLDSHQGQVTRVLDADPVALDMFGRYRLIGDLMRDEASSITPVIDRVRAALDNEPTVLAPPPPAGRKSWLTPIVGVAVAASVAAAAVMVTPRLLTDNTSTNDPQIVTTQLPAQNRGLQLAAAGVGGSTSSTNPVPDSSARWHTLDGELGDRLNRLIIEHQEFSGRMGINGPLPHVGLVSYDAR